MNVPLIMEDVHMAVSTLLDHILALATVDTHLILIKELVMVSVQFKCLQGNL